MTTFTLLVEMKPTYSSLVIRITLGIVLIAHGAHTLLRWFGRPGFSNTIVYLTDIMHRPFLSAVSVVTLQFFGALLLILGALTRAIALCRADNVYWYDPNRSSRFRFTSISKHNFYVGTTASFTQL